MTTTSATPLTNVVVRDDNGTPGVAGDDFSPTFVGGDTNGNGLLDLGEIVALPRLRHRRARPVHERRLGHRAHAAPPRSPTTTWPTTWGRAGIRIVKLANGDDANAAPGVVLPVGAPLVYTYLVHGDSAVALAGVAVRDDNGTPGEHGRRLRRLYVSGDANANGLLDFGETWLFTSQGVPAPAHGAARDVVNLRPRPRRAPAPRFRDTDVAYVTGRPTSLTLIKAVNALDPAHPQRLRGREHRARPVRRRRHARRLHLRRLDRRALAGARRDCDRQPDHGRHCVADADGFNVGDADRERLLDRGEIWIFRATGTALAGLQTNIGTATGVDAASGATLTRHGSGELHGRAGPASRSSRRSTPSTRRTRPPPRTPTTGAARPRKLRRTSVVCTYVVRSTVDLTERRRRRRQRHAGQPERRLRADARLGRPQRQRCARPERDLGLPSRRVRPRPVCTRTSRASAACQRAAPTATTTPRASSAGSRTSTVEKATNAADPLHPTEAEDADTAPGLIAPRRQPVVWTYLVTNTGNVALTVSLRDDSGYAVATADDFTPLLVGGDMNGERKLDPNETWLYTSVGVVSYAAQPGQYVNIATLTVHRARRHDADAARAQPPLRRRHAARAGEVRQRRRPVRADLLRGRRLRAGRDAADRRPSPGATCCGTAARARST